MRYIALLALLLPLVVGRIQAQQAPDNMTAQVLTTYADIVYATYEDTLTLTLEMQQSIDAFLADPTADSLEAARDAWRAAREPYGKTEAFRFYGGPIDDEDNLEGLINAWPMDEIYLDYVEGISDAGLINDRVQYPEITPELLESLNEQGAEENISVGYHAIEFLLWGQDLSEDGAGQRAYTDYTTSPNAKRRAETLTILTQLLVDHLLSLVNGW